MADYEKDHGKKFYMVYAIFYVSLALGLAIFNLVKGPNYYYYALNAFAAVFIILIPKIFKWVFNLKNIYDLESLFLIFCTLAIIGGSVLGFYAKFPWWDKMLHTLAGFILAGLGFILFVILEKDKTLHHKIAPSIIATYCWMVAIVGGVFWELYEYGLLIFFGIDAVNFERTGMADTMGDMFVCIVGGLIMAIILYRFLKYNKSNFLTVTLESFYVNNIKNRSQNQA